MIRRTGTIAALTIASLTVGFVTAGPARAQDAKSSAAEAKAAPAKLASVNGRVIPKARIDFVAQERAAQGQPDNEQMRKAILETLVNKEVLAQEAERKGMTKSGAVQMQVDLARQEILARAVVNDYLKGHPIKDETVRAEYEKIKAQRQTEEYKARHILVDKEDEAKAIIERLNKGEKFEDLAKLSKDPGSKDRGGELDWASTATYVKPFGDALAKLEKGKVTQTPVQTQFGWHVIQLEDTRTTQFPPFDQVKQQIIGFLQNQEIQKLLVDLRSKAKIDLPKGG